MSRQQRDRRDFLKLTAATGVGFWAAGLQAAPSKSPNEQINFACIGVGGKGGSDSNHASAHGNIVAICDCDEGIMADRAKNPKFEMAQRFTDYRKMFDEIGKSIDAVTVSTPDHNHAPAAARALRMGKHTFCQKPLTHSIEEARVLATLARENKVATQMGNQGTSLDGLRQAAQLIKDGVLGKVSEVHVWTNRPIWPQGNDLNRPEGEDPVPTGVNWDAFIGPAKMRPYKQGYYHTFKWRGWWDFGTGALGDMGCHTMNMPFMALDLRDPISAEANNEPHNKETYPKGATVKIEFGPRGDRGPVTLYWYEGGRIPSDEVLQGSKAEGSGCLLVGEKGRMYSPNDYGASFFLLPKEKFEDVDKKNYKWTYRKPMSGDNDSAHFREFVEAIRGGEPAVSNFVDYAGPLTETVLMGNLAVWAGRKVEWDAQNMKVTNFSDESVEHLIRHQYRKGWEL